jgi:hypothetical protein
MPPCPGNRCLAKPGTKPSVGEVPGGTVSPTSPPRAWTTTGTGTATVDRDQGGDQIPPTPVGGAGVVAVGW